MSKRFSHSEAVAVDFGNVLACTLPRGIDHIFWLDCSGSELEACVGADSKIPTIVYGARSASSFTENFDFFLSRESLVICIQNPGNVAFLVSLLPHFTIVDFITSPDAIFVYLTPQKLSSSDWSFCSLSGILENLQVVQTEDRKRIADELRVWKTASLRAKTPESDTPEMSKKQTAPRKRLKIRMVKYLKPYIKFLPTPFYRQALRIWNLI